MCVVPLPMVKFQHWRQGENVCESSAIPSSRSNRLMLIFWDKKLTHGVHHPGIFSLVANFGALRGHVLPRKQFAAFCTSCANLRPL